MKLSIHFPNFSLPGGEQAIAPTLAATARAAEEADCGSFTVMDHWFQMEQFAPPQEPMLEGYTTLGFLAGQTSRITLGLLVTGVTYRHPGLLAKTVTTLDVLSGGRAQLGIGAAWYEREHLGLDVPFPPLAERFERLEEALQICRQMWSTTTAPSKGASTSWPRRSAPLLRSSDHIRRCSSGAAESARPFASSLATATSATSSPQVSTR